jgi:hypothetical protein
MYVTSKVKVSQEKKWMTREKTEMNERKKERKEWEIWEWEKNMSMRKVNSPVF